MSESTPMTSPPSPPKWIGVLPLLVGGVIIAAATGLMPIDETKLHAPRWVLFLCGAAFVAAGGSVLTYDMPRARNLFAPLIVLCLGTIGLWIAIFGDAAYFGSNLPLSREANVATARIAFGTGGALCYLLVAVTTIRGLLRRS